MATPHIVPAVFTASATSAVINTGEGVIVGLMVPSGFAGTTIKFQGSDDPNGTFNDIFYVSGVAVTALTLTSVAASKYITLSPELLAGFQFLKLVSSGSETCTINVMVRDWGKS